MDTAEPFTVEKMVKAYRLAVDGPGYVDLLEAQLESQRGLIEVLRQALIAKNQEIAALIAAQGTK